MPINDALRDGAYRGTRRLIKTGSVARHLLLAQPA